MTNPRINIIVAVASDGAIGRGGDLLFYVSDDLKHFKQLTVGHPVIMGRRTFQSLPKGALPGRRNIVITSQVDTISFPGAETVSSLQQAIDLCHDVDEIFIIGGASIYRQAIDIADRIFITRFDRTAPDADVFFPDIDPTRWTIAETSPTFTDPKTAISYTFQILIPTTQKN